MSFSTMFNIRYLVVETPTRLLPLYKGDADTIEYHIGYADRENRFVFDDAEQPDQKTERLYVVEQQMTGNLILRSSILRNKLTCNRTNKTKISTAAIRHPDSEIEAERFRSILLPS